MFEKQKEQLQKANIEKKKIAENLIIKAPDSVIIFREARARSSFGSVTSRDVINEINSSLN